MYTTSRFCAIRLIPATLSLFLSIASLAQVSVRSVKVLGSKETVEIEVQASDRLTPETRVLTGPDRLVVDFPNAVPSSQVRNQSIDRGDVKDVRVGLFQAKPPVTRVVIDLKSARSFQVFPYGRTVMIKVTGNESASNVSADNAYANRPAAQPSVVAANYTTSIEPITAPAQPRPALEVSYRDGRLGLYANKATLSEVLYAIQQRTGADISIPAGAEQEKVVAEIEPAPAAEVLARLLNGSRFNFLILNSASDPRQLDRVILSTRTEGGFVPPPAQSPADDIAADDQPVPPPNQPTAPTVRPAPAPPAEQPQAAEENAQEQ
ncbi:MAG TPA: AMIN domain-containing protein [Dongiaceae bacterium]|nr:AMIN domain-containing protein [Dongiaceae bacterium]